MFTRLVLDRIWSAGNYSQSGVVKDGKTVDARGNEMRVKQFEEIFRDTEEKLSAAGFSIKRVSPLRANAVIRVFRCEGWKHDDSIHWIYGSDVFARNLGVMLSAYTTLIEYDRYLIKWIFYQDEMPSMEPHFVDYFVKISY